MSTARRRALRACAALLVAAWGGALSGCGQKSALYLPQKKKSKVPADESNPEGTAPATPGTPGAEPAPAAEPGPAAPTPPAA
ncbi:MAG: lipoprotein [Steroidobacteraceae bacterium]